MAEAEDVITDVARHATVFAQDLWKRHRKGTPGPAPLRLADVAARLDLLITAVFGRSFAIRTAQAPAPPTLLARLLQPQRTPPGREAIAATDGRTLWLPDALDGPDADVIARMRTLALRQAMRAVRGGAALVDARTPPLLRDLVLLVEAHAADHALLRILPGMAGELAALRRESLARRPPVAGVPARLQRIERLLREPPAAWLLPTAAADVLAHARALFDGWPADAARAAGPWLQRDRWTGDLRLPPPPLLFAPAAGDPADADGGVPRSARLARRPEVRDAADDEDDQKPGAWMVQSAAPQEKAEDPMGLQRPTDRDADTAADEFADALSELPEARLVPVPGKPKEILIGDDAPPARARRERGAAAAAALNYPEWDWRAGAYRDPGAAVHLLAAPAGAQQWVDITLAGRGAMLHEIRRRFELLRAQRTRLHRQLDGDRFDLAALVDGRAAGLAGQPLDPRVYADERRGRRDLAVLLLVDVSGSTDGYIAADRRVIDIEREALLLVCIALEGLQAPYSVQAFSGEGPQAVVVRSVKAFSERYDDTVARRIAGLEPEHYTRAGAALRHATALLMREPAQHRLLLMLSDGKPNDIDDYEGRYGVEDMRQAVCEARLQAVTPFCLTVDRQAANYLPFVFGPQHYALLPRPELLPTVLLEGLRRLVVS